MQNQSSARLWWLIVPLLGFICQGCEILSAEVDGKAWLMFAEGKIQGADVKKDLGYGGVDAQPGVDGAVTVLNNRLAVDWVHLDRSEDGQAGTNFRFGPIAVQQTDKFRSRIRADIVRATYGYVLGPRLLSLTPMVGISYARDRASISGTSGTTTPLPGVPFSSSRNDESPFPVVGALLSSIPVDWLELRAQATGFGLPQGYIIDGQLLAGLRYGHARADAGWRIIAFDFADNRIRLQGATLGAGLYY